MTEYGSVEAAALPRAASEEPRRRRTLVLGGVVTALALTALAARGAAPASPAASAALDADPDMPMHNDDASLPTTSATDFIKISSVDCGTYTMKLACEVTAKVKDPTEWGGPMLEVSLYYRPVYNSTESTSLWTNPIMVNANTSKASFPIFRLQPNTEYKISAWYTVSGSDDDTALLADESTFTSSATGYDVFDNGAILEQTGSMPPYGMLLFDLTTEHGFKGIVGVDATGHVIWYADQGHEVHGFDQFDESQGYKIGMMLDSSDRTGLVVVEPDGTETKSYVKRCKGTEVEKDWYQLSNEARVAPNTRGLMTIYQSVGKVSHDAATTEYFGHKLEHYVADHVAYFDLASGNLTMMYDISDYLNPVDNMLNESMSMQWLDQTCAGSGGNTVSVLDWSGASSISTYTSSSTGSTVPPLYIVCLRNINTIMALKQDLTGLQWIMSPDAQMNSNFTFSALNDEFFDPIDAQMIEDDTLIVFDGGLNRQGCKDPVGENCFSRALEYRLTFEGTHTAVLQWDFTYQMNSNSTFEISTLAALPSTSDIFTANGGSIQYYGDHFIVGFTMTQDQGKYADYAYYFVVDGTGNMVTMMRIRRDLWDTSSMGAFRVTAVDSIFGESSESSLRRRRS